MPVLPLRTLLGGALSAAFGAAFVACTPAAPPPAPPPSAPLEPAPTATEPASPPPAPIDSTASPAPSKAGPDGAMCGGLAGFGCSAGLYCAFALEAHCGAADRTGICRAPSQMCTQEFAPVCGCDDKTYPNACHAAREGISVAKIGECAAAATLVEGKTCGTRGVPGECAPGLYCAFRANCGHADEGGVCTKKPQMCTRIYAPVCGCDGKTHGSACTAASAGVSIAAQGECTPR